MSEMNETSMTIRSGRVRELVGRDRAGVDALDHGHAVVLAQAVVELAVGDVERDHVLGAALEQAVREAAGRGADVERAAAGDVEAERVERVGELDAAARDVGRRAVDLELDLGVDHLPRLLRAAAAGAEVDLARDHGRGGARSRFEEPALRQQGVQAHAGHGRERYSSALARGRPPMRACDAFRPRRCSLRCSRSRRASATPRRRWTMPRPTASISRGAPLTFAVRTTAPAGSVVVRVSGYDEVDDTGLLTGPEGTWLDETATPALEGLAGLERPRDARSCASGPATTTGRRT